MKKNHLRNYMMRVIQRVRGCLSYSNNKMEI